MEKLKKLLLDEEKRTILMLIISGIALLLSFIYGESLSINPAWIAIILCGIPIIKEAVIGLVTEFDIKADVLVSIALVASVIIGEIFAAGEVAFIMTLGALLEEHTVAKAKAGIEKLIHLTPRTARVIRNGEEVVIEAEKVLVNDRIRVSPGETVAVDGIIVKGETSIDQAVMTGESMPVDKTIGDEVFSGTVNQFGTFEMKATKVGEDSSLQRMIRLVKSADAGKAKIVGVADKWATWIVVIALVSAVMTWLITGEIIRSVTILVVFCPCALVLATPTAIMAGIGNATKYGILIKEGDALERLAKVKKITFDKTGTLTYGKLQVAAIKTFGNTISDEEILNITASAELYSEHPLGKAIVAHFKSVNKKSPIEPNDFKMIIGRGVSAKFNGDSIIAGNKELLKESNVLLDNEMLSVDNEYRKEGSTVIYVAKNNKAIGIVVLSDVLRADAKSMVDNIEKIGTKCVLLTGDNKQSANYIGKNAGIEEIHSECLPEDKLSIIKKFQQNNQMVCMVGDGVNDAPALKTAFVGIAMGGVGSDIAVEAADIALVSDDIKHIPHLLKLSQKTMKTINWNLGLSMALNFIAIILAMLGILNPIVGALVHNIGSVVVIIHSSLLLKWK